MAAVMISFVSLGVGMSDFNVKRGIRRYNRQSALDRVVVEQLQKRRRRIRKRQFVTERCGCMRAEERFKMVGSRQHAYRNTAVSGIPTRGTENFR